jgi:hypothetical protein
VAYFPPPSISYWHFLARNFTMTKESAAIMERNVGVNDTALLGIILATANKIVDVE